MATNASNPYSDKTKERKQQFVDPKDDMPAFDTAGKTPEQGTEIEIKSGAVPGNKDNDAVVTPTPPVVTPVVNNNLSNSDNNVTPSPVVTGTQAGNTDLSNIDNSANVQNGQPQQGVPQNIQQQNLGQENVTEGTSGTKQDGGNLSNVDNSAQQNVATTQGQAQATQPLFKTDPKLEQEYRAEVQSWGLNGNTDMFSRPMVNGQKLIDAGYTDVDPNSTATIYTMTYTLGQEDPKGKYKNGDKSYSHNIVLTPILENGTVFTQEQLDGYLDTLLKTAADLERQGVYVSPVELDKEGARLIVGMDTDPGLEDKIHQAHQKYYLGQGIQPQNTTQQPTNAATADGVATGIETPQNTQVNAAVKTGEDTAKTTEIGTNINDSQTDVKSNSGQKSVEDYEKELSTFTPEQLKIAYDVNKGIEGEDPNRIKAFENLLSKTDNNNNATNTPVTPEIPKSRAISEETILSDNEQAAKNEAKQSLQNKYSIGSNKDLTTLPVVSEARMVEAGWTGAIGKGNQAIHPMLVDIEDKDGKTHKVLMSPIANNGAVMTQDDFKDYVGNLGKIGGIDAIKAADESGCGLIIKADATDDDLKELDKIQADIVKGETPSVMTYDEELKAYNGNDEFLKGLEGRVKETEEKMKEAEEALRDPTKSPKHIAATEGEKKREEFDKETEEVKKRHKRAALIGSIGDMIQVLLNSTGTYLGAKSAELTPMSGAANKAAKEETALREKRRDELSDAIKKDNLKLVSSLEKDYEYWRKYLETLNRDLDKYKGDNAKAFRDSRLKAEAERNKTVEQGKRRVNDNKIRMIRDAAQFEQKKELAKIPRVHISNKTSHATVSYDTAGGNKAGSKPSSRK